MPSLQTYNCFNVLAIPESNEIIETVDKVMQIPDSPSISSLIQIRSFDFHLKWERRLPSRYVIAAMGVVARNIVNNSSAMPTRPVCIMPITF